MAGIDEAARALAAGRVVILPTDTVYGVAAIPSVPGAVQAVFEAKGRPGDKPLPVLGASLGDLERVVMVNEPARELARRFWPGPLTLVLPRAPGFTYDLGGSHASTVAVRIPGCDVALELLGLTGPLAVTSANASGMPPAHTVEDARLALPQVEVVVDGGTCAGEVSTVLSLVDDPLVLRDGAIQERELRVALGR